MCAERKNHTPGLFWSVLTNKCPRCRTGRLFANPNPYDLRTTMRMPQHCAVCGQRYEPQTGFFFGTGYVSYALSVALIGTIFVAWTLMMGLSYKDNSIFWCLAIAALSTILLQPILQRLSRSIWIAFFIRYERNWHGKPAMASEVFQ